jgi:hypothetical protein
MHMLVCKTPEFVQWQPDFSSSEQENPEWTKLLCGDVELSNAITWIDWFYDPAVQVVLCESCGTAGCQSGGYVHVSRLGKHLLWTQPHVDQGDTFKAYEYRASQALKEHGAIAIPVDEWIAWRERLPDLPAPDRFPKTTRRDLLGAWQAEAPLFGRWDCPDQLLALARERAVAGDPLEPSESLEDLETVVRWFGADPGAPVEGELVPVGNREWNVATIYFDVPDTFDRPVLREWAALARRDGRVTPVFGNELVLAPEPT